MPAAPIANATLRQVDEALADEIRLEENTLARDPWSPSELINTPLGLELLFGNEERVQRVREKHPGRGSQVEAVVACPAQAYQVVHRVDVCCLHEAILNVYSELRGLSTVETRELGAVYKCWVACVEQVGDFFSHDLAEPAFVLGYNPDLSLDTGGQSAGGGTASDPGSRGVRHHLELGAVCDLRAVGIAGRGGGEGGDGGRGKGYYPFSRGGVVYPRCDY